MVVFMADDQRQDAMSLAGHRVLKTPNMDRIGREGMRFRNMFVTHALCSPSRATLLTGLYSHSHGVLDNKANHVLGVDKRIVSETLREAGYEVAFCGKSHVTGALRDRKWDYYFGYRGQGRYHNPLVAESTEGKDVEWPGWMDDVVTDRCARWIGGPHAKPFLAFVFFKAPHGRWDRPERHKDLFGGVTFPKPHTWALREQGSPGKPRAFHDADNKIIDFLNRHKISNGSFDQFMADYHATIVGVDDNVGKVLRALDERGLTGNTAVLYTSDNGFFLGEWAAFDKRLMHEPSIRVPLLVRYPGVVRAGTQATEMALNVDIAPTLLDLAGVPAPAHMHGRSLVPLLEGKPVEWRKDWLYEYFEYPIPQNVKPHRGVRTERYKLIHYYAPEPQEIELYDLQEDPGELRNLYGQPGTEKLTARLRARLDELRRQTGDTGG